MPRETITTDQKFNQSRLTI